MDHPGHGLSQHKPPPHVITDLLFYAKSFHDHVAAKGSETPVNLVAHSMSATPCVLFAACYPELVSKLVLVEGLGPVTRPGSELVKTLKSDVEFRSGERRGPRLYKDEDEAVRARVMSAGRMPGDQFISEAAARLLVRRGLREVEGGQAFGHDANLTGPSHMYIEEGAWLSVLKEVRCPVLFVRGSRGWPGSDAAEERIRVLKEATEVTVREVEGGGHHLHLDDGTGVEVARIIDEFLL